MSAGGIIEGCSSNSANKCASCRHQRRRCPTDCIFRPYFPLRKQIEFESARRIFGISNMERMLRNLGVQDRANSVESIIWEATCWSKDSINGPLGCLKRLIDSERQAKLENQLLRKQLYNLSRSGRSTQIDEKQQNQTNEQMLNMEGSASDQVYATPDSDIARNYCFDSEEGLELHWQGGRILQTTLQSSPLSNYDQINGRTHVRDINGNHGRVAQASSTPNPIAQMQRRRNLESIKKLILLFQINPQEIDHGRTIVSLSQANSFPHRYGNEAYVGDIGQVASHHSAILQTRQIRNQLDEVSSQAAFFNTPLANHHQVVSLPSAYNHQWRGFQALGVDFHRSANVAPEPTRVRGTNVLQAPYHVDQQNNVR
uniref:LOB domain-containing protein n=1 Tax=Salix viminalis TaxID=40686 RepID=A0A6N2KEN7_SALVM